MMTYHCGLRLKRITKDSETFAHIWECGNCSSRFVQRRRQAVRRDKPAVAYVITYKRGSRSFFIHTYTDEYTPAALGSLCLALANEGAQHVRMFKAEEVDVSASTREAQEQKEMDAPKVQAEPQLYDRMPRDDHFYHIAAEANAAKVKS